MATTLIDQGGDKGRDPKKTTIIGSPGNRSTGTRLVSPEGIGEGEAIEAVVAWLVIVGGPGQGKSIELSYGMSTIGRGGHNRVQIDFGDSKISDDDHFRIAYDGENREFHLIPGRGTNLVYVEGKPLLGPQVLTGSAQFRVGSTTMRFVPLCSKEWDWSMVEAPSAAE
jgi:FHA domain